MIGDKKAARIKKLEDHKEVGGVINRIMRVPEDYANGKDVRLRDVFAYLLYDKLMSI